MVVTIKYYITTLQLILPQELCSSKKIATVSLLFSVVLYRYFKVLIQEMDLRLDLGFLFALLDLFTQADMPKDEEVENV